MSPTARTLQWHKARGFPAGVVERFNVYSRTRNDLFGFIDIITIKGGCIVAIQATGGSGGNHAERLRKILSTPAIHVTAIKWLGAKGRIEIWSWRKLVRYNADGTKSKRPRWAGRFTAMELNAQGGFLKKDIEVE